MLKVKELRRRVNGKTLFEDLSFTVTAGEHIAIVGESGGGKSTLLKVIAEADDPAVQLSSNMHSAMVLQEGALLDHLSPIENLRLVQRYNKGDLDKNPESLLSSLNITNELFNRPVSQLSGGQVRRIAIARALVRNPQLLLFDEPDAGLDVPNLQKLAEVISKNCEARAVISVSHNPIYITQVAHKVYRLGAGKLSLIAAYDTLPSSDEEQLERQKQLQMILAGDTELGSSQLNSNLPEDPPKTWSAYSFIALAKGVLKNFKSVFSLPESLQDQLAVAGYVFYLSGVSGLLFFGIVGLMLGGTIVAVVKLLADNALEGIIGFFLNSDDLLKMMGGVYVLYLAPPIGGMLFAARSGSIVSGWLGQLQFSRKIQALALLNVPTDKYLRSSAIWAMFLAMLGSLIWFTIAAWCGGVLAAHQLFGVADPMALMTLSAADVALSSYTTKIVTYSLLVAFITIAISLAEKQTAHEVNIHTTKAIIYSTVSISLAELLVILWR